MLNKVDIFTHRVTPSHPMSKKMTILFYFSILNS